MGHVEAALIHLPIQIMHGVHLRMIVNTKVTKGISIRKTKRAKISSQFMKKCKPRTV
jgi:hypothetical protein